MLENYIQSDLFNDSEIDHIKQAIKILKERTDNCRRGLFARHNELAKLYYKMDEEHENIKKSLQELKNELQSLRDSVILVHTA